MTRQEFYGAGTSLNCPRHFDEDWPEGLARDDCTCSRCGNPFVGHKRRTTCKICSTEMEAT